jgi:hypothetical protein
MVCRILTYCTYTRGLPEMGKVTLKSSGDEALNDKFILKSNSDEAFNDCFP